ncbi:1,3-beta-glucanosyltransferase [Saxophila tyrrhenica]|uniref:1,3-beta-glucanosyltransferase n=1 Tax=Saxophila tyrrhenica TaxID=1690608 RepID=A0AAV9PTM8_9PEZI|nr:1,3-beta-glucanosyltransferase [Saxophila tyrrhenica]
MKTIGALATALAATAVSAETTPAKIEERASKLPSITTKGNAFFNGNDRFYLRGVDYQPGGSSEAEDPLADPSICNRDIPYFKQLGLNTIRVYTVDNSKNHDECMNALAQAGIYLVLDVNTPDYSLNRDDPGTSYNPTYLQSIFSTIDAFASYSNTLAFFSGNEVLNAPNTTNTAPYVKAVTRDMKQYIAERGYRSIPVGYSAADVSENQYIMAQYMDCGSTPERSDFYAINNYEWCDPSSFEESGWSALVDQYQNYSIPLFFSEYGCIDPGPRTFAEVKGLLQPDMTGVFSGGLIYEYSNEGNGYGIVNINGNKVSFVGDQFSDFKSEMSSTSAPSGNGGYSSNNPQQECPGQSENWDTKPFTGSALPAIPSGAEKYFKNGAGKGPGLSGDGSQNAPGGSSQTASANAGQPTQTYGSGSGSGSGSSSSGSASSSGAAVGVVVPPMNVLPLAVMGTVVALSFAFGMASL